MAPGRGLFVAAVLVAGQAQARELFVDPSGSDAADGSSATPFATIQKGVGVLAPGDTLTVRAGSYAYDTPILVYDIAGTAAQPVVIQAEGDVVLVDGADKTGIWQGMIDVRRSSFVTVRGFTLKGSGFFGVYLELGDHVTVEACKTDETKASGVAAWASSNVTIRGNDVRAACNSGQTVGTSACQECISLDGAQGFLVENNRVHDAQQSGLAQWGGGEGIDVKNGSSDGVVRNNEIFNVVQLGIYVDAWENDIKNVEIYGNWVHHNANGIVITSEQTGNVSGVKIHDNVVTDNGSHGISINHYNAGVLIDDVAVYSNTLVHNGYGVNKPYFVPANQHGDWGVGVSVEKADITKITVVDNIVYDNATGQIVLAAGLGGYTVSTNLVSSTTGTLRSGITGDAAVRADPEFVDFAARDLHLLAASPAIDKGLGGAPVAATDFDGKARVVGAAVDLGAFEYAPATVVVDAAVPVEAQAEASPEQPVEEIVEQSGGGCSCATRSGATPATFALLMCAAALAVRRKRVAVLVPWLIDPYERSIAEGAVDAAREVGAQVICVTGDGLDAGEPRAKARQSGFELVTEHPLDAVIGLSGSLAHETGVLERFYGALSCRAVSVGIEIAGHDSVIADNEPGLRDLVLHLIDAHGRKRIAFIAGPVTHPEAQARLRAYRSALELRGLPFDPELVMPGAFDELSGVRAVEELWDRRHTHVDAIVATNDQVARAVLDALAARGARVPEDVSVTGFDDSSGARVATPPLATVRQPTREMGAVAMRLALEPAKEPRTVRLETEAVPRASCGCTSVLEVASGRSKVFIRETVLGGLRAARTDADMGRLLDAFEDHVATTSRYEADQRTHLMGMVTESVVGAAGTLEQMLDAVLSPVQGLAFESMHVVLREPGASTARLYASYERGGERKVYPGGLVFEAAELLPEGMLPEQGHWRRVLSPLIFGAQPAGYVLFGADVSEHEVMLSLQVELGAGIERLARERQLEVAYAMLKSNTERLIVAEKMASLVRMTAGLAHEMNTPLLAIRAGADELSHLIREGPGAAGEMTGVVDAVRRSAAQLADFIRSIRGQVGETGESRREAFDPTEVVRECCEGRAVAIESSGEPELYGDRSRFGKLVSALVDNAVEATGPKGGGTVRVMIARGGQDVEMRIVDHGVGIAKEHIRRVFDPMFSTKPFGSAAGMGLTVCHAIATVEYGGTIEIESTKGEGTTVVVRLPRRSPSVPAPAV